MKFGDRVVLLLDGIDGFAAAISGGLHPNINSGVETITDSFEFSLEFYGVKDRKASGKAIHFIDSNGNYEISILILQSYEPPLLACALNEVLLKLAGDGLSKMRTLIIPSILPESKLKQENKNALKSEKVSVYGIQLGPTTDITKALSSRLPKASPFLQINSESLATLLHFIDVMNLPTVVLIGVSGRRISSHALHEEIEVMCEIGDHLASSLSLSFSKEKLAQSPAKTSRDNTEAWRALYG